MEQSKSQVTSVVISKDDSPKECVFKGIEKLRGITNYIKDGDQVFIKFNLTLPQGFPANTNMDTLEAIIDSCHKAGAKKIYVGSYPLKGLSIKSISDLIGLNSYFLKIGAELVFLDYSNYYFLKNIKKKDLNIIKIQNFSQIKVNNEKFEVHKIILNADKFISVNQVNVDPIFKLRLSLLNSYSLSINKSQSNVLKSKNVKDLMQNVINAFTIRKPDLVINDLFYILEGAGPYIYKDSKLKKTGLMVIGDDAIAVDIITSTILSYDVDQNLLLREARNRKLGIFDISKIQVIGENLNEIKINIQECVSKLEDILLPNFSIKTGNISVGDFEQAYHFLNLLKTHMIKDIKYISKTSFLVGDNPPMPEDLSNVIIFGDAAIKSTKLKKNKNILKLPGNPPNIFDCIDLLIEFYKKRNVPSLYLFRNLVKSYRNKKINQKLQIWEGL